MLIIVMKTKAFTVSAKQGAFACVKERKKARKQ